MIQPIPSAIDPVQTLRCHDSLQASDAELGLYHHTTTTTTTSTTTIQRSKTSDRPLPPSLNHGNGPRSWNYVLESSLSLQRAQQKSSHSRHIQHSSRQDIPRIFHMPLLQRSFHSAEVFTNTVSPAERKEPRHGYKASLSGTAHVTRKNVPGVKRWRQRSDVDGPNTAAHCRKKRRVKNQLVVGRLPHSSSWQPSTHSLNRHGRDVSERRIVKPTTSANASRRPSQQQPTSYLRYSLMNRLRKRLGIDDSCQAKCAGNSRVMQAENIGCDDKAEGHPKAPWRRRLNMTMSGQKPPSSPLAASSIILAQDHLPTTTNTLPVRQASPSQTTDLGPSTETETRVDDAEPTWALEDDDEDCFAFLHLDDEQEEDSEHVYCNFDAIFGGQSADQEDEDRSYDEYLDDLDGISWRI